jgi:retron-type reverse transcriptase
MKRVGYLIDEIADLENLRLAFWKAKRGKSGKEEVRVFGKNLDKKLISLSGEILSSSASVGDYSYFKVYDPKERLICAAAFRERVLHHAIMNVCGPLFEKFQIYDSYATRPGKGQYAALERVRGWVGNGFYFCKLDVRKFFDSIDHELLYERLCGRFKDGRLLNIFRRIIDSYSTAPGRGVPIGNLTSQYFANFYLAHLDHFIKEKLRVKKYARYMDDMVAIHSVKENLITFSREVCNYCENELKLKLKPVCLNGVESGIPFLGYVIFPGGVRLNRNSKKRFLLKHRRYMGKLRTGEWSQKEYARCAEPLFAFTRFANSIGFRRSVIEKTEAGQGAPTA